MKKPIIAATLIVCLVAWCVRYYKVNGGTFAVHYEGPSAVYGMHEMVSFGDNISNNALEQPGYSVSLESARILSLEAIGSHTTTMRSLPASIPFLRVTTTRLTPAPSEPIPVRR